ncbi:MAG: hypothetical protein RMJ98_00675 [Myxococcales bacterium]|nr:hypothetical protein [Polyangiaceae bacterium]MDW8247799.1 hypothetical protein [Myxococcales bacterium]
MANGKKTGKGKNQVEATSKKKAPGKKAGATKASAKKKAPEVELGEGYADPIDIPVADLCQEARELEVIVAKMGTKLVESSRLDPELCAALKPRRKLLEEREQEWLAHRLSSSSGRKEMIQKAERLKKDIIAALRYFLHQDEAVQARVDNILPGTGLADLIDDLQKLATLLRENAAALARADLPKDAATRAEELAQTLGHDEVVRSLVTSEESRRLQDRRNRAFWYLREAMDEIRAAGRYVFRNDPRRLALFRSSGTRARQRPRSTVPKGVSPTSAL